MRQFVAKLHCAYIDVDKTIPGMVYDRTRAFPTHGNHPHQRGFMPLTTQPTKIIERFDKLAHVLAVYPTAFPESMLRVPRLILLLKALPPDVPIIMPKHALRDDILEYMVSKCAGLSSCWCCISTYRILNTLAQIPIAPSP